MSLSITTEWETLQAGAPEDRACFAAIGIFAGDLALTKAEDTFVGRVRESVHLSAYRLAEWFAWNWWRQRWEPHGACPEWAMAHRMVTIGGGYVWPNISIVSDGERVALVANHTEPSPSEPLRYITDFAAVFGASEYERVISRFIEQVQGQLREEVIEKTNLDFVWAEVCAERKDAEMAKRRQLEALLGFDPDEADEALIEQLIVEAQKIGERSIGELAATSSGGKKVPTYDDLAETARKIGSEAQPREAVQLRGGTRLSPIGLVPAWKRGAEAAIALRTQEQLGAAQISNSRLADLSGVSASVLNRRSENLDFSYAIDEFATRGRVVLRSKWETGRRFELARILGDRIAGGVIGEKLYPATRTYTYRQKLQRSFAAEFLCPFEALQEMLDNDYSEEKQEESAEHFSVSPLTVRTMLLNHGLIERDNLSVEYETA